MLTGNDHILVGLGIDPTQYNRGVQSAADTTLRFIQALENTDRKLQALSKNAEAHANAMLKMAKVTAQSKHQLDGMAGTLQNAANSMLNFVASSDRAAFAIASFSAASSVALVGLISKINETATSAATAEASLKSLSIVAKNFGKDADQATLAAQELAKDGLLSIGQASAALRNLLANQSVTVEQATAAIQAFKDSASANPREGIPLADMIMKTTEGIKLGLSSLTDNSGISKNLSEFYKEWAAQHGTTMAAMTNDQKQLAAVVGMTSEAMVYQGMAAERANSLLGAQDQLNASVTRFNTAIGTTYQGILTGIFNAMTGVVTSATTFVEKNQILIQVATGATALLAAFAGSIGLINAAGVLASGALAAIANAMTLGSKIQAAYSSAIATMTKFMGMNSAEVMKNIKALQDKAKASQAAHWQEQLNAVSANEHTMALQQNSLEIKKNELAIQELNMAKREFDALNKATDPSLTATERRIGMLELERIELDKKTMALKRNEIAYEEESIARIKAENAIIRNTVAQQKETAALAAHAKELKAVAREKGLVGAAAQREIQNLRAQEIIYYKMGDVIRRASKAQAELNVQQQLGANYAKVAASHRLALLAAEEKKVYAQTMQGFMDTGRVANVLANDMKHVEASNARVLFGLRAMPPAAGAAAAAIRGLGAAANMVMNVFLNPWVMLLTTLGMFLLPMVIDLFKNWGREAEEQRKKAEQQIETHKRQVRSVDSLYTELQKLRAEEKRLADERDRAKGKSEDLATIEKRLTDNRDEQYALTLKIAKLFPELISHVDKEGKVWLQNAEAIERALKAKRDYYDQEDKNQKKQKLDDLSQQKIKAGNEINEIRERLKRQGVDESKLLERVEEQPKASWIDSALGGIAQANSVALALDAAAMEDGRRLKELLGTLENVEKQIKQLQPTTVAVAGKTADTLKAAWQDYTLKHGALAKDLEKQNVESSQKAVKLAEHQWSFISALDKGYAAFFKENAEERYKFLEKKLDAERELYAARNAANKAKDKGDTKSIKDQQNDDLANLQRIITTVKQDPGATPAQMITKLNTALKDFKVTLGDGKIMALDKLMGLDDKALKSLDDKAARKIRDIVLRVRGELNKAQVERTSRITADSIINPVLNNLGDSSARSKANRVGSLMQEVEAARKAGKITQAEFEKRMKDLKNIRDKFNAEAVMDEKKAQESLDSERIRAFGTTSQKIQQAEDELRKELRKASMSEEKINAEIMKRRAKTYMEVYVRPILNATADLWAVASDITLDSFTKMTSMAAIAGNALGDLLMGEIGDRLETVAKPAIMAFGDGLQGLLQTVANGIVWVAQSIWTGLVPAVEFVWGLFATMPIIGQIGLIIGAITALVGLVAMFWPQIVGAFQSASNEAARFNKEVKEGTLEAAQLQAEKAKWVADKKKEFGLLSSVEHKKLLAEAVNAEIEATQKVIANTKLSDKERSDAANRMKFLLHDYGVALRNLAYEELLLSQKVSAEKVRLGIWTAKQKEDADVEAMRSLEQSLEKQLQIEEQNGQDVSKLYEELAVVKKQLFKETLDVMVAETNEALSKINNAFGLGLTNSMDYTSAVLGELETQIDNMMGELIANGRFDDATRTQFVALAQQLAAVKKEQIDATYQYEVNTIATMDRLKLQSEEESYNAYIDALQNRQDALLQMLSQGNLTKDLREKVEKDITDLQTKITQAGVEATYAGARSVLDQAAFDLSKGLIDQDEFRNAQMQQLRVVYDRLNDELRAFQGTEAQKKVLEEKRLQVIAALQDEKRRQDFLKEEKHQSELDKLKNAQLRKINDYFQNRATSLKSQRDLGRITPEQYAQQMQELQVEQAQGLQFILDNANLSFEERVQIESQLAQVWRDYEGVRTDTLEQETNSRKELVDAEFNMAKLRLEQQLEANQITQDQYDKMQIELAIKYENQQEALKRYTRGSTAQIRADFDGSLADINEATKKTLTEMVGSWGTLETEATDTNNQTYLSLIENLTKAGAATTEAIGAMIAEWVRLEQTNTGGEGGSGTAGQVQDAWEKTVTDINTNTQQGISDFINQWVLTGNAGVKAAQDAYNEWIEKMGFLSDADKGYLKGLVSQFIGTDGSVDAAAREAAKAAFDEFVGENGMLGKIEPAARTKFLDPLTKLFHADDGVDGVALAAAKSAWDAFIGSEGGEGWLSALPQDAKDEMAPLLTFFKEGGDVDAATKEAAINAYKKFTDPTYAYSFHNLSDKAQELLGDVVKFFNGADGTSLKIAAESSAQAASSAWQNKLTEMNTFADTKIKEFTNKYEAMLGATAAKGIADKWSNPFGIAAETWMTELANKGKTFRESLASAGREAISGLGSSATSALSTELFGTLREDGTYSGGALQNFESQVGAFKQRVDQITAGFQESMDSVNQSVSPLSMMSFADHINLGGQSRGGVLVNLEEEDDRSIARWIRDMDSDWYSGDSGKAVNALLTLKSIGEQLGSAIRSGQYSNTADMNTLRERARAKYSSVLNKVTGKGGFGMWGGKSNRDWIRENHKDHSYLTDRVPFRSGGLIPDTPQFDGIPATLHKGEMVLPREITQRLVAMLAGNVTPGGVNLTIQFGDVSVRNDQDIQKLADQVGRVIMKNLRLQQKF